MKQKKLDKKAIKQKIISLFLIFSLLLPNFFYARPAYAFVDINQLLGNVVDWAKDIVGVIEKIGGNLAKAGLSTALIKFAQDLGKQTANQLAGGGSGQEPLYFNFSLEDTLKAAVDSAVGSYLDDYIAKSGVDLCKPIGVKDVSWKFKLMLNVIPELKSPTLTQYKCTVSTFIDNARTSIDNIITSIQKSFGKECFSEFEKDNICGVVHAAVASLTAFDINSLKSVYGYDSSTAFCKEATYYLKAGTSSSNFLKAAANVTAQSMCGVGGINKNLVDQAVWTSNKAECLKRKSSGVFDIDPTRIAADVFNLSDPDCLVSFKYCKFDNNGSPVFDKAKQKRFLSQYNNCYRSKVKDALGSLIEVGPALTTEEILQQELKNGCDSVISSILDTNQQQDSDLDLIKRAIISDNNSGGFTFFITKLLSPLVFEQTKSNAKLSSKDINGFGSIGIQFDNGSSASSTTSTISSSDASTMFRNIILYRAKSINDLQSQQSSDFSDTSSRPYDILYFKDDSGTEYFYYLSNGKLNKVNMLDSSKVKAIGYGYSSKKENMINLCTGINVQNSDAYLSQEKENDAKKMAEISAQVEAAKANAKEITEQTYDNGGYKSVTELISKQVKTPATTVANEANQSLHQGDQMVQPTGDVVVDAVMAFLTVFLKTLSGNALNGLFDHIMPKVDESIEDFDANSYIEGQDTGKIDETKCDNTNDASKFQLNTPCGANYQCQSCCCTTNAGTDTGIMYCFPISYCQ